MHIAPIRGAATPFYKEYDQPWLYGVAGSLDRLVKKDKITAADKDAALARIQGSTSYQDLKAAQIVIEAATENHELKVKILKQLDAMTVPNGKSRPPETASG